MKILAALAGISCVPSVMAQNCPNGVSRLSVQTSWFSQPQFAGWEVPNNAVQGAPTYAEECLRVQVRPGGPDFNGLEEIQARRADIALVDAGYIAQAIEGGMRLTVVANYLQRAALKLMTLKPGMTLNDLQGGNVGVWCCGFNIPIEMMIAKAGLTVNYVAQSWTLSQLYEGTIDAASVMVYNEMAMALQAVDDDTNFLRQRTAISEMDPSTYDVPFMHNTVVVLTDRLAELEDSLIRLFKVVNRAWLFCRDNGALCAASYPRSNAHYVWQMREMTRMIFPSENGLGVTDAQYWDDMVSFMVAGGQLSTTIPSAAVVNNSLILASHNDPRYDTAKVTSSDDPGTMNFCAPYGSDFYVACDVTNHEHTLCPPGKTPAGPQDGNCTSCSPGKFSYEPGAQIKGSGAPQPCAPTCAARMLKCTDCPAGQIQGLSGQSSCDLCERGRFRNSSMSTLTCSTCAPGKSATESGSTICTDCNPGQYKDNVTTIECSRCPRGRFMSGFGATLCDACPGGKDTLSLGSWSSSECTCSEGQYTGLDGNCKPCPEGMTCSPGSSHQVLLDLVSGRPTGGAQYPKLEQGYWTDPADPLSVFLCINPDACPGKNPGTCSANRVDLACARCAENFYPGKEGECIACNDFEVSGFLYPWFPILLGPVFVVGMYMLGRDRVENAWMKWTTVINCIFFVTLLHYQAVGLIMGSGLQMPKSNVDSLGSFTFIVDVAGIMHPECMGYSDFTKAIILKTVAPIHVCLTFLATWVGSQVVFRITGRFKMEAPLVFNACMAVVQAFFVPIAFVSFQIFMCYDHPNGKTSLRVAPQVLCGSDQWSQVAGLGVVAILVYVVGLLSMFLFVLVVAPRKFHDLAFRSRWKFLVLRCRPGMWWWSFVVLLKSLSLSLAQVLFKSVVLQTYWVFFVFLMYAAGLFSTMPWLNPKVNLVDGCAMLSLLFFTAMASWFAPPEPSLAGSVSTFISINSFVPMVFAIVSVGLMIHGQTAAVAAEREKYRRELAGSLRKTMEVLLAIPTGAFDNFVADLSDQDFHSIWAARSVILAELMGQQPGRGCGVDGIMATRLVLPKVLPTMKRSSSVGSAIVNV